MLGVHVEQTANHSLILRVVSSRLVLEELDTAFAQCDCDLYPLFAEDQVLRPRKEIRYDSEIPEGFVCVFDFRAHRFVCPSANSLHQIFESLRRDR